MSKTQLTTGAKWLATLAVASQFHTIAAADTARPMRFERLSLDQGLSQSAVMAITQDDTGFMWFGTENGLNRYDGYEFRHYKHQRATAGALSNDFIPAVAKDLDGNLWIATDGGGLAKRPAGSDRFEIIRHDASDPRTLASNVIQKLHVDEYGTLWVGTRGAGLDRLPQNEIKGDSSRIAWIWSPATWSVTSTTLTIHAASATIGCSPFFRTVKALYGWAPQAAA